MTRLALLALLLLPLAAPAQESTPTATPTAEPTESAVDEIDRWHETLREARDRLERARARAESARYSYRDGQQRDRRGPEKAALLAELEAAERELADAQAALPVLLEEARRAGVPPGVLREFEN